MIIKSVIIIAIFHDMKTSVGQAVLAIDHTLQYL